MAAILGLLIPFNCFPATDTRIHNSKEIEHLSNIPIWVTGKSSSLKTLGIESPPAISEFSGDPFQFTIYL